MGAVGSYRPPVHHVAITGAAGLVGSNIARAVLADDPGSHVTLLDLDPDVDTVRRYLVPYDDRVTFQRIDVADRTAEFAPTTAGITHVVHAAARCHVPDWELADPASFVDVNVIGTINVLRWARTLPELQRVVHVSSGGVYGEPTSWSTDDPQSEDGPLNAPETYAVTKLAGEQLARRLAALDGIDLVVVRPSAVWGPMERVTPGRRLMSLPHAIGRAVAESVPLVLSARTLDAGGDFLSATDLARGVVALLDAPDLEEDTFNVAFGRFTPVIELLEAATAAAPSLRVESARPGVAADIDMDPLDRRARWNAYDITRLTAATTWRPRPLGDQFVEYLGWLDDQAGG